MEHQIDPRAATPVLRFRLAAGEALFATETSAAWLSPDFEIKTARRGTFGARVTGESIAATTYTAKKEGAQIAFSAALPGDIVAEALRPSNVLMIQRGALLAAENTVRVGGIKRARLEGTAYAEHGFSVRRLGGPGAVFVAGLGTVTETRLESPRDSLWVEPSHLLMFDSSVGIKVEPVSNAAHLAYSDEEPLYYAILTGPGRVWLQSGSRGILNLMSRDS